MTRWRGRKRQKQSGGRLETVKRNTDFEVRRLLLEENQMRQVMIGKENQLMVMDPN
jgi:hypothetical protein